MTKKKAQSIKEQKLQIGFQHFKIAFENLNCTKKILGIIFFFAIIFSEYVGQTTINLGKYLKGHSIKEDL